ncbi:PssD/Cps14F family polysaccharide biosynthesis glycosyltransferase [Chloroflexota bacterium]
MAKICIVCAHGGHLTEALYLMDAFEGHDVYFITYKGARTNSLVNKYLFDSPGFGYFRAMVKLFYYVPALLKILWREKPAIIVSTGGEIAIPAFYIAKLFGSKTVFVETWTRIQFPTWTGKLVYPISDVFLVQWPEILRRYGKRAKYVGGIV